MDGSRLIGLYPSTWSFMGPHGHMAFDLFLCYNDCQYYPIRCWIWEPVYTSPFISSSVLETNPVNNSRLAISLTLGQGKHQGPPNNKTAIYDHLISHHYRTEIGWYKSRMLAFRVEDRWRGYKALTQLTGKRRYYLCAQFKGKIRQGNRGRLWSRGDKRLFQADIEY